MIPGDIPISTEFRANTVITISIQLALTTRSEAKEKIRTSQVGKVGRDTLWVHANRATGRLWRSWCLLHVLAVPSITFQFCLISRQEAVPAKLRRP